MDRDVLERARWWSWRRQRLDRSCRGIEDALRSVIAVPSSHPHGPLALLARVPRLMRGHAVHGVIDNRKALRLPAMRRSVFLFPAETAPLAFSACHDLKPYRWLISRSVGEAGYKRLRGRILEAARSPMRSEEIRAAISGRVPADLTPVLQVMCAEGVLLRIKPSTVRANDLSYCATESWLGEPLRDADATEALTWLAGDYLSAFGPVTVEDFAWWAGVTKQRAVDALAAHDPLDVGGGAFIHHRDERAFTNAPQTLGRVNLLPKWDPYTMGYEASSRARFADPRLLPVLYDAGGNSQPVVLVEGRVQGVWDVRLARDRAVVKFKMFDEPGPKLRAALDSEAGLLGEFLEAARTEIERERARKRPARAAKPKRPVAGAARRAKTSKRPAARKTRTKATSRTRAKKAARKTPPRRKPARRGE